MQTIDVDTHVLVWLYLGDQQLFPPPVQEVLESCQLVCSPMAVLEMDCLREIGRLRVSGGDITAYLQERISLRIDPSPFLEVISAARALSWTRDPFDRLIVATASLRSAPLLTKDSHIRAHYPRARWGE